MRNANRCSFALAIAGLIAVANAAASEPGLVGYWTLRGDCEDHSGQGHHGINHHVDLAASEFNGRDSYIEVPNAPAFGLGTGPFSISALVNTDKDLGDVIGDVLSKFDPPLRRGINLAINVSGSGYNSTSNARYLQFGIDDGTTGQWADCGRPNSKTQISDALTVFNGDLYAGTSDGPDEADWAHVYRYQGGQQWEDCGRLGGDRTRGVYTMIVHDGALYAATSASHGPQPNTIPCGRVYRYEGGKTWEDIGQPGTNQRLHSLASFNGRLYVAGFNIGPNPGHVYSYEGGQQWKECGKFDGWPHVLAVHDGKLYAGYPKGEVYVYDGVDWKNLGNPLGSLADCDQVHSLGVYQGELHAGTWPLGKVAVLRDGKWVDRGRLADATEVIGLTVYNGSFYAGTIPRAEVFRFDGDHKWTSIRRLFDPPGFEPVAVGAADPGGKRIADWSRASSLTVFDGKLFVSSATCHRTMIDPRPDEIRGKVFSFSTGACVTNDRDLGAGWKHIAAVRDAETLTLYVDGELVASKKLGDRPLDLSNDAPLRIGFGPQSYFAGKIREVRLYNIVLPAEQLKRLANNRKAS